jgi:hypothetical protein
VTIAFGAVATPTSGDAVCACVIVPGSKSPAKAAPIATVTIRFILSPPTPDIPRTVTDWRAEVNSAKPVCARA